MDILFILIPIAIAVMGVAIAALLWAIKNGQFDDMDGPAHRILMDDDDPLDPWNQKNRAAASEPKQPSDPSPPAAKTEKHDEIKS